LAPLPPQIVTRVIERPVPAYTPSTPAPVQQLPSIQRAPAVIERPASPEFAAKDTSAGQGERVTASRLLNPSLTVPQGTIIAAVLETALDSTRPGAVRAIVSRDVRSFDGSRVLIPRGSRLYGEYTSDLSAGQKRALVIWHRLTRPDAVIIDMGSPAADPLGRAGIGGKVDTHFFERFGGAILQSALDIGVSVASRSITDYPVIVALPGSTQQVTRQQSPQVQPTLKVQQGTSVSVFVARDLDFSTVDR
jgi:type IV secretion system protein VirB10